MELDIGKHCAFAECNQLDYLPFKCYGCEKNFCDEHYKLADHHCPKENDLPVGAIVPVCPICMQPVPVSRGVDPNIRMNKHIQDNCPPEKKKAKTCSQEGCSEKIPVPMLCKDCKKEYCVKHRMPGEANKTGPYVRDHECKKPDPPKSKQGGFSAVRNAASQVASNHHLQSAAKRRQEILQLRKKGPNLTDTEQVRLATLESLETQHGNGKNCIVS